MYPFLLEGTKCLGGISKAPKNLQSFNGSFVNFVYQVASDYAGACLYYSQPIVVNNKEIPIGEFVDKYDTCHTVSTSDGDWMFADVDDSCVVDVAYKGENTSPIRRVYKRKYDDLIYTITTESGASVMCSRDHIFAVDCGELLTLQKKASELWEGMYLVNTKLGCRDKIKEIHTNLNTTGYVYEIETECHWYSTNSILTHNCATVEYLHIFDWFARNQYGDNYLDKHEKEIAQEFQGTVYALNQPASARGRMLPLSI